MDPIPKNGGMGSAKRYLATAVSVAASAMVVRTVVNDFLPTELRNFISAGIDRLGRGRSATHALVIQKNEGLKSNELFDASITYLGTKISPTVRRLRASKNDEQNSIAISIDHGEEQTDTFQGAEFRWQLNTRQSSQSNAHSSTEESRSLVLSFNNKHKDVALSSYIPHILEQSRLIKTEEKKLQLHMNMNGYWIPIDLQHPSSFDTLAMETELKQMVEEDLKTFVKRKDYYKRIGKAWKRGYLLHGPPGTGKTSLIAAMANYLRFDIYDLDLKAVRSNTMLKALLVEISSKSMVVIEDIDCCVDMPNRDDEGEGKNSNDLTLSGLLNFIDGLWSSSGEERVIVFTTNYKDRLDPALVRPGRMDVHIHMGYCGTGGFRVLASNYHGIDGHPLFGEIDELLTEVEVTPAEVAGELLKRRDASEALQSVVRLLQGKRKQQSA